MLFMLLNGVRECWLPISTTAYNVKYNIAYTYVNSTDIYFPKLVMIWYQIREVDFFFKVLGSTEKTEEYNELSN